MFTLPALSVCQPWADAIVVGGKDIENRTWRTKYRGWLLIHASMSLTHIQDQYCRYINSLWPDCPVSAKEVLYNPTRFHRGAVIGAVRLVDCLDIAQCPGRSWAFGPRCWVLADPVKFATPYVMRGALALWNAELPECPPELRVQMEKPATYGEAVPCAAGPIQP